VGARPVGQELVDEGIEIHLGRRPGRVNVDRMKWLTPHSTWWHTLPH
jgi:hypothetical protein